MRHAVIQGSSAPDGGAIWYEGSNSAPYMAYFDHIALADNSSDFGIVRLERGRARFFDVLFAHNDGVYMFDDGGPLVVLYPAFYGNVGQPFSLPSDGPPWMYMDDPSVLSWVDDGDPSNDVWTLRPDSALRDLGHPDLTDLDGTRSGVGPGSGATAPRIWALDSVDADGDGMSDGWERRFGLDPSSDDSGADPDGDGVSNLAEYQQGTLPDRRDTDGNGVDD
jgi:hypothetical protein